MDGGAAHAAGVPLIKRFTGGGTVVVDADTILTCLVMHGPSALPHVPCFPRPIMAWTERFFGAALQSQALPHLAAQDGCGAFTLRENGESDAWRARALASWAGVTFSKSCSARRPCRLPTRLPPPRRRRRPADYVVGHRKFGGNAQAISRDRWLHHTSLLWDFRPDRMALLRRPAKAPEYRAGRGHLEFVAPLREACGSREGVVEALCQGLQGQGFAVREAGLEEALQAVASNALCGTRLLLPAEYLTELEMVETL